MFVRLKQKKKKRKRKKKLKSYELEFESAPVCALTKEGSVFSSFFQASKERERVSSLFSVADRRRETVCSKAILYRGSRRGTEI